MNLERDISGFAGFTVGLVLLMLLAFGVLEWLDLPTGNFLDWIIGLASFWWLLVIVTFPWNIYFGAKGVLAEAAASQEKGITVEEAVRQYVSKVERGALWVALGLHLVSAVVLYWLAVLGIGAIGYVSSAAAVLLTGLRPAVSAYRYLVKRLESIGKTLTYPREDVVELRSRVDKLAKEQERLAQQMDLDFPDSWCAKQQRTVDAFRHDLAVLAATYEQLKATNEQDHERISKETRSAIAQLNEDSLFLDRVREIIRFFKEA